MYLNNPTKVPMGLTQEDWKHLIGVCYHYEPLKNYFYCLFSRDFIKNFPETIFAPGQIYRFRQQFENAKDFSEINFSLFKTILAKNNLNYIIKHFEVIFIMRLRDFFYGSLEDKIKEELKEGSQKEEEILRILYSLSLQTLGNAHRYRNKSLFNDCFHFDLNISFNSDKYHTLRNGYEKAFDFIKLAPKEKKKACAYYKEYVDHYYFSEMNKITSFYKDHREKKKSRSRTYSYNPLTNYFQILGINPTASQNEFKKAYLSLAKRYHPDNKDSGDLKRMQEINTAFEVLSKYYNV